MIYWLCQLELVILHPDFTSDRNQQMDVLQELYSIRVKVAFFENKDYLTKINNIIVNVGSYVFSPKMFIQLIGIDQPINLCVRDSL